MVIIVMGVSGSGKSTVGKLTADLWASDYIDADDYHPQENIQKMKEGVPLDDSDRVGWLMNLRDVISKYLTDGKKLVMACSALKKSYREVLGRNDKRVKFVYLDGDYETIFNRMQDREGHFMPEDLLKSQFDTLEVPDQEEALHYTIEKAPLEIARECLSVLVKEEDLF
ncbi:MAG: gluconokinase [Bacteroidia bacterium]|nr:gluconokinase [Bacteroidia bacterium]